MTDAHPYDCPRGVLRSVAQSLGTWERISQVEIQVGVDDLLQDVPYHTPRCPQRVPVGPSGERRWRGALLENITWDLCSCQVEEYVGEDAQDALDNDDPAGEVLLYVTLWAALVERAHQDLLQDPSIEHYRRLGVWTSREHHRIMHGNILSMDISTEFTREDQERSLDLLDLLFFQEFSRHRSLLESTPLRSLSRAEVTRQLIEETYLRLLPRDDTPLLVGVGSVDLLRLFGVLPHYLREHVVWDTCTAGPSATHLRTTDKEPMAFLRIPAYAYDAFLRLSDCGHPLNVQAAPWNDAVDLTEVASLWNPRSTDPLCSLVRACETSLLA